MGKRSPSGIMVSNRLVEDVIRCFTTVRERVWQIKMKLRVFPSTSTVARLPPRGSVKAELLQPETLRPGLRRTRSLLNDMKELTEQLSDFGSCVSSQSRT